MNNEHYKIIKQGFLDWNKRRNENPDITPDLSSADLRYADLNSADLSGSKGLLDPIDYIMGNFETNLSGIVVYKIFGLHYLPSANWRIERGSILKEVVDSSATKECACGINVATLDWVERNIKTGMTVWECLIRWEWACAIVVPYNTDGKIRCGRLELTKEIVYNLEKSGETKHEKINV